MISLADSICDDIWWQLWGNWRPRNRFGEIFGHNWSLGLQSFDFQLPADTTSDASVYGNLSGSAFCIPWQYKWKKNGHGAFWNGQGGDRGHQK